MLINILLTVLLVAAFTSVSRLLGPRSAPTVARVTPYETGMVPMERAVERMTVPYIRFALLFVLFDIETAFLLPWVELRHSLDQTVMLSSTVFLGLLSFMLAYMWRKGALSWS